MCNLRTVVVYQYNPRKKSVEDGNFVIATGVFHEFSQNSDSGDIYTVAVIETPSGTILTPAACFIKFTSPINDKDA